MAIESSYHRPISLKTVERAADVLSRMKELAGVDTHADVAFQSVESQNNDVSKLGLAFDFHKVALAGDDKSFHFSAVRHRAAFKVLFDVEAKGVHVELFDQIKTVILLIRLADVLEKMDLLRHWNIPG